MDSPQPPNEDAASPVEPSPPAAEPAPDSALVEQQTLEARVLSLEQQGARGANWFYWVAGLSLVNSIILLIGGNWGFIVGLGSTYLVDIVATGVAQASPEVEVPVKLVAFGIDLVIAVIVAGFGWLSRRRISAVFAIGMVLYLLDGLVFVWSQDWAYVVFHGFVLWCMWSGLRAYRELGVLVQQLQYQRAEPTEEPPPATP